MFLKLILLFTLIPVIEIYILIKLGASFGVGVTLVIVVGTGVLGAYLAKREGYRIFYRIQQETRAGRVPAGEMVDALLVFISGVVLLTPGLITDIAGVLLLFPLTRMFFKEWLMRKFQEHLRRGYTNIHYHIR